MNCCEKGKAVKRKKDYFTTADNKGEDSGN